ncbi:MAG: tRNA (guanosine(46)-N7)-methyltransferase TrmB [Cyclobacteriaceae bacterium]|jgi:tRNA (guanine-N7-)-methyltransferase
MGRSKLDKFKDNELSRYVVQPGKEIFEQIKGNWRNLYFKNEHDLVLELACGRGEYTIGLAREFPDRNFIGIDIKGPRIWRGMKTAEEEKLMNTGFLRGHIQNLEAYFEKNEVDEIWIAFPDPRPKGRDERRRLTHPRFINIYRTILKPGGRVYLKTDNHELFEYSLEVLCSEVDVADLVYTRDLYNSNYLAEHHGIQTTYEKRYLEEGTKIKYLKFRFSANKGAK